MTEEELEERLSEARFVQAWIATLNHGDVVTFNQAAKERLSLSGTATVQSVDVDGRVVHTVEHGFVNGDWFVRPYVIQEF